MSLEVVVTPIDSSLRRPWGEGARRLQAFLDLPSELYRDDPNWIRPLDMDLKGRLTLANPFFEHAQGALLLAYRDGKLVGRCTAQIDQEHLHRYKDDAGMFGFLDTVDDPEVAKALLDRAASWVAERGMKSLRGPYSLSINEELGCLVEGFDTPPMVMMPHHKAYQGGLIEKAGFTKLKDVYAWKHMLGNVSERARKAAATIDAMPEVTMRPVNMRHADRDIRLVMDIFNDAWSDNWGFLPLTESELKKAAADMKMILRPELTQIVAIHGEPVGMCIVLPNVNDNIQDLGGKLNPINLAKLIYRLKVKPVRSGRLILLGIRKKLRHQRKYAALSTYMYTKIDETGVKHGIRYAELSWTLEDNGAINAGIRLMGAKIYKRYRVYERALS